MPYRPKRPRESDFTVPPPFRTDIDPFSDPPSEPQDEPFRGSLRVGTGLSDAVRTQIIDPNKRRT